MIAMQLKLHERLQSMKMVANQATFVEHPDSLESLFAISKSIKDAPPGRSKPSASCSRIVSSKPTSTRAGDPIQLNDNQCKRYRKAALEAANPINGSTWACRKNP